MYRIFYGMWYNYGIAKYVFALSLLVCLTAILSRAIGSPLRFVVLGTLLVATLIAPGALVLVSGVQMPIRIFVAAWTALAMVFLLAYETSGNRLVRNVISALTILYVVQCMYIFSMQQAATWSTQRHDLLMAGALNHDILAVVDAPGDAEIWAPLSRLPDHHKRLSQGPDHDEPGAPSLHGTTAIPHGW